MHRQECGRLLGRQPAEVTAERVDHAVHGLVGHRLLLVAAAQEHGRLRILGLQRVRQTATEHTFSDPGGAVHDDGDGLDVAVGHRPSQERGLLLSPDEERQLGPEAVRLLSGTALDAEAPHDLLPTRARLGLEPQEVEAQSLEVRRDPGRELARRGRL